MVLATSVLFAGTILANNMLCKMTQIYLINQSSENVNNFGQSVFPPLGAFSSHKIIILTGLIWPRAKPFQTWIFSTHREFGESWKSPFLVIIYWFKSCCYSRLCGNFRYLLWDLVFFGKPCKEMWFLNHLNLFEWLI